LAVARRGVLSDVLDMLHVPKVSEVGDTTSITVGNRRSSDWLSVPSVESNRVSLNDSVVGLYLDPTILLGSDYERLVVAYVIMLGFVASEAPEAISEMRESQSRQCLVRFTLM